METPPASDDEYDESDARREYKMAMRYENQIPIDMPVYQVPLQALSVANPTYFTNFNSHLNIASDHYV